MMIRIILLVLLKVVLWTGLAAQPLAEGNPEKIISSDERIFMNATWSPDGEQIAVSSFKYNGIWICDKSGENIHLLTSDKNAGFGYKWSADGTSILARPVVIDNKRRFHQVKLYDVKTGEDEVLFQKSRSMKGLPVWTNGGRKVAMKINGDIREKDTGKTHLKSRYAGKEKTINFGGALVSAAGDTSEVSFPEFEGRYVFNLQTSPDGSKIVFEVSGLGLHVANADGTRVKQLGYGEHATWMTDNRYIVVTRVFDDGYNITSGKLFSVDTQTGKYHPLLTNDHYIALKPFVSPDGSKLLFDDPDKGAVFVLKLQ